MPLILPKEDATQEEINAWIVETQENYDRIEKELEQKTNREKELMEHNQKLFLKITSKKDKEEEMEEDEEIPFVIDKEMYDKLSEQEKEELKELIGEE